MAFRPTGGCATSQTMTVQPQLAQPEIAATPEFTFKVAARRADKVFPLDSYGLARELGGLIL